MTYTDADNEVNNFWVTLEAMLPKEVIEDRGYAKDNGSKAGRNVAQVLTRILGDYEALRAEVAALKETNINNVANYALQLADKDAEIARLKDACSKWQREVGAANKGARTSSGALILCVDQKQKVEAKLQEARELLLEVQLIHEPTTLIDKMNLESGHTKECLGCRIARFLEKSK